MRKGFARTERIAGTIKRKLAQIIQHEFKDSKSIGFVTLSSVTVSKDLRHAWIYFTVLNAEPEDTLESLNIAAGNLRSILAKSIALHTIPQLHFVYDKSVEYGVNLSRLIDKVSPKDDDSKK